MTKIYQGAFSDPADRLSDAVVTVTHDDLAGDLRRRVYHLNPRLDLRNHSPTGFAWGYGGSGPSQLALALCADLLGDDDRASAIYHEFKRRTVERWPQGEAWALREDEARAIIAQIENGGTA